jgi:hypothetical protein
MPKLCWRVAIKADKDDTNRINISVVGFVAASIPSGDALGVAVTHPTFDYTCLLTSYRFAFCFYTTP